MTQVETILAGFTVLSTCALLLKITENLAATWWVSRKGRTETRHLYRCIGEWRTSGKRPADWDQAIDSLRQIWGPQSWLFTNYLWNWGKVGRIFATRVFRNPTVMACQCAAVLIFVSVIPQHYDVLLITCAAISALALWFGAWTYVSLVLVKRLTLGYLAAFPRMAARAQPEAATAFTSLVPPRRELVSRFVLQLGVVVSIIIVAYATIYAGIDWISGATGHGSAFTGTSADWRKPFEFLYFSVVTIATVGYGDIQPGRGNLLAQFAVASEILSGMCVFVILITAFSSSTDPDAERLKDECASE